MNGLEVNLDHSVSLIVQPSSNLPYFKKDLLPTVVVRPSSQPLDNSQARQKKSYAAEFTHEKELRRLDQNPKELLTSNVVDLEYFRSFFLFPLEYLRGILLNVYRWAENFLSPEA